MSSVAHAAVPNWHPVKPSSEQAVLSTLVGEGPGLYQIQRNSFFVSFTVHALVIVLLLVSSSYVVRHPHEIRQQVIGVVINVSPYVLHPSKSRAGGGGGGGDRSKLSATKGALPRLAREQLAPPTLVVRKEVPKLPVEATVVVPPEIPLPKTGSLGDPLSAVLAPPSNGIGSGGGIGTGSGGGIGSGRGPGVGPGWGGGIGGGPYQIGAGVTAPRVLYAPNPDFSEEARKNRYQGTVVLSIVVGPDGRAHNVRVERSLGMGLDDKAIEAIARWKFEPGRKNGIAVAVLANIEVNFRLY